MTKAEKKAIKEWASKLSNDELEREYYDAVLDTLGSEAEEMYERGWDMADVLEREKHERDFVVKANILGQLCEERGITLWGNADAVCGGADQ